MKIYLKNDDELARMRHGGKILQQAQAAMRAAAAPGVTLLELDAIAEQTIRSAGAVPGFLGMYGFPNTICAMVNEEVVHGIPSDRKLVAGDLLSVDCGVKWKNYHADAAFSLVVGGPAAHPAREKFQQVVKNALEAGCRAARIGNHVGDIGYVIEKTVRAGGYSICREYTGHGVGRELHEDPHVFNYGKPGTGPELKPGMTLAIEPIVAAGSPRVKTLKDGWMVVTTDGSDGCQWEHFGVVTADGLDIFA